MATGKKIAVVCTGAVGGYAGAHMVQAGEDVTFIDFWPEHVDHMKQHGLTITHLRDVEPFTVPTRALHLTEVQHLVEGEADRHRVHLHEILRHGLGDGDDQAVSGAGRVLRVVAELHERGDDRRHRRLGQDAGLDRQLDHGRAARAGPDQARRRQVRVEAHRLPGRRGAWPHHRPGQGGLRAARPMPTAPLSPRTSGASAGRSWSPT